ncbi:hypothetical protein ACFRAO_43475 [Streptomyces sp. NPDC056656]
MARGELRHAGHIIDGLEKVPVSFPEMFQGRIMGKMIAKIN